MIGATTLAGILLQDQNVLHETTEQRHLGVLQQLSAATAPVLLQISNVNFFVGNA
jgi:hypothetical protein